MADPQYKLLRFSDLSGWNEDDHVAALAAFRVTSPDIAASGWDDVCASASASKDAKAFFENGFLPVQISDGAATHFTGYYEPELAGSLVATQVYQYPIYAVPPDFDVDTPYLTRTEIETTAALSDRGLEIAWLADPVDRFFLQVQGSGRIRLPEGQMIRVGFAAKNGHPYTSIGNLLVQQEIIAADKISADAIRRWARENPSEAEFLMRRNDSYVFFRRIDEVPADQGPLGAMGRSLTPLRTLAVDPEFIPLGAPVWVDMAGRQPIRRLMIAQDVGSAIKGPARADIFVGTGEAAGRAAGAVNDGGRMVVLLPCDLALALTGQKDA